jgi:hypothetical protein
LSASAGDPITQKRESNTAATAELRLVIDSLLGDGELGHGPDAPP